MLIRVQTYHIHEQNDQKRRHTRYIEWRREKKMKNVNQKRMKMFI